MNSKQRRVRRSSKTRLIAAKSSRLRLVVNRSNKHIYAQIITPDGSKILAGVSTLGNSLEAAAGGNVKGAEYVGKVIAEKAVSLGITSVSFDRSGYSYHGRIKALADAARSAGLNF
jgi:large subunit ribosomal protein L18